MTTSRKPFPIKQDPTVKHWQWWPSLGICVLRSETTCTKARKKNCTHNKANKLSHSTKPDYGAHRWCHKRSPLEQKVCECGRTPEYESRNMAPLTPLSQWGMWKLAFAFPALSQWKSMEESWRFYSCNWMHLGHKASHCLLPEASELKTGDNKTQCRHKHLRPLRRSARKLRMCFPNPAPFCILKQCQTNSRWVGCPLWWAKHSTWMRERLGKHVLLKSIQFNSIQNHSSCHYSEWT